MRSFIEGLVVLVLGATLIFTANSAYGQLTDLEKRLPQPKSHQNQLSIVPKPPRKPEIVQDTRVCEKSGEVRLKLKARGYVPVIVGRIQGNESKQITTVWLKGSAPIHNPDAKAEAIPPHRVMLMTKTVIRDNRQLSCVMEQTSNIQVDNLIALFGKSRDA